MSKEIIDKFDKYYLPCEPGKAPIVITEGKGAVLKDIEGKEYIDSFSGIAVVNMGHCHPDVVDAIQKQATKLLHTSGLFYTVPAALLAEKIASIAPEGLKRSYFANSGAEAIEGAVKLAKKYAHSKGRLGTELISLECSFHGRTALTLTLTGQKKYKVGLGTFANYPGVAHAPAPYCYRCPLMYPKCGVYCASEVERIANRCTTGDIAAFIMEPIIGEGGIIIPPDEYIPTVMKICKEQGMLFIADEVQTGFGRCGKMWGVDLWGVKPDIMTFAKGIADGLPLGGFVSTDEIAKAFGRGDHFSTFGGNPLTCAAGVANIEAMLKEKAPQNAQKIGDVLRKGLVELMEKHDIIGDVRARGLMIGVELVKNRETKTPADSECSQLQLECRKNGVLVGLGGVFKNVVRIQPPIVMTEAQANKVLVVFEQSLRKLHP
jgi:4-aminobutyrate aminotransferase/(S)-3-amino-2-methylpropionate transaminase